MIKGTKKLALTSETILQKLTPYDIYRKYFGEFKVNKVACNWMRGDKNPSFIIGNKHGELIHKDFSCDKWKGDCFAFVKQMFSCSFDEALKMIDVDFGLGLSGSVTNTGVYKKITSEYNQPEEKGKRYSLIQVVPRAFTKEELLWWQEYYQNIEDLRENNVFSFSKAYLNKQLISIKPDELKFGYYYNGTWKIYFPNREKRNKWLSNVPLKTSGGLENLRKDKNTLICCGKKEYMVCRKIYPYTCYVQNESLGAFSGETVKFISENSKEIYYGGNSDEPGKTASHVITKEFGWKHINPPDRLLPEINDFAGWGKLNLEEVKQHFINKELL